MEIASLVVNVAGNVTGAVNSFKSLEQTSRTTAKKIESNFSSLKNISATLFGTALIKNIVDTGIQFQSIRQSLQAITGSAEGMNDAMKFVDETAQRTGVNILNASKDFRLLLGSAQGAGYAMQDIKNIFSGVSDASLVLGMRADDVTGLMRAFGQIMSKGCFGIDTPVLMYDGTIKNVQDIRVGDMLMGNDYTHRTVLKLARNKEQMYEVLQDLGIDFTCNEEHILSLKDKNGLVKNITVKNFINTSDELYGYKNTGEQYNISLNKIGIDNYYGFEITGNRLFCLGDGTVVHNTVQAEELKGQIGDRLSGALGLASKAMGVTNRELLKMMETGTLMSKDFLPKFSEELKKTFSAQVPLFQGTALKALQDFDNAFMKLKDTISTSGLLDIVTKLMSELTKALNSIDAQGMSDIKQVFSAVSIILQVVIDGFKALKSTMNEFNITIGDIVVGYLGYITASKTLSVVQGANLLSTKAMSTATKTLAVDLALMGVSMNASVVMANIATTAFNALKFTLSRIIFPVAIATFFVSIMEKLAEQAGYTAKAFDDMVQSMSIFEIGSSINKTTDDIIRLRKNLQDLKSTDLASQGDNAGNVLSQIEDTTKAIERLEAKLKAFEGRRDDLAKGLNEQAEMSVRQRQELIATQQQDAQERLDAQRLQSLDETQKKLEMAKKARTRVLQDIYESRLENGEVVIDFSKFKTIGDTGVAKYSESMAKEITALADKQVEEAVEDVNKKIIGDVTRFQKELTSLNSQIEGLNVGTEFSRKWGEFVKKFSKEEFAKLFSGAEKEQLQAKLQEAFDKEKIIEFQEQLDELRFDDMSRNMSQAEVQALKLNMQFEKMGTAGNEALEKKNEVLKQIRENAKNLQEDMFKAQYGTVNERWQMRKIELENEYKEASIETRNEVLRQNEKLFYAEEANYQKNLQNATTLSEVQAIYAKKSVNAQKSWGEEMIRVFDMVESSMTNAMVDFLDITSKGFLDFGNMAKGILQEVYREIVRIQVVKPLVSSIMGGLGGFGFAWNGGIANGSGFQRFAGGYVAGGGYNSYDSLSNDTIPALISKGEAVIPASVTNANRGLISAMIASRGTGRKFANGYVDGSSGNGNLKVEIINESGQKMETTSVSQSFDSEGMILSVVINAIHTNKGGLRTLVARA